MFISLPETQYIWKDGMMEQWNSGKNKADIDDKNWQKSFNPLFQHSNIPSFQLGRSPYVLLICHLVLFKPKLSVSSPII